MRDRIVRQTRRTWTALAAIFGVAVLFAASGAAVAGPACATARDEAALNTRVLQTELMVAALSCGEQQRYNTFVSTFKVELIKGGQGLKALFNRVHGSRGSYQMNAFVTKLANDAAQRTANGPDAYCASAASLFNEVLRTPPGRLAQVTAKPELRSRHGFPRCRS